MKRNNKFIILTVLIISILASCSPRYTDCLRINLKTDRISHLGYDAAVYKDRIYYISNELGASGIYSMGFDGTDIRIEIENPSITSIEISDSTLFFNGLFLINKRESSIETSSINNHTIYSGLLGETTQISDYTRPWNINSFFVSPSGYTVISYGSFMEELFLYDKELLESFSDIDNRIATLSFSYSDSSINKSVEEDTLEDISTEDILKNVYQFGDMYIIAEHVRDPKGINYITYNEKPYILDTHTGDLVLSFNYNQSDALKAFYMDKSNIYCAYKDMVVTVDRASCQVVATFVPKGLSNNYHVTNIFKHNDIYYIIAQYWRDHDKKWLPLMGEKLYILNPLTFETSEVLDLGQGQRIIGIYDKYIILLVNSIIYKANLDNGQIGEKIKLCNVPSDIYLKNYSIDYAGDWMFIYKIYPEHGGFTYGSDSPGQHLFMKVNLVNGEIIRNEVELDFSALDNYKLK